MYMYIYVCMYVCVCYIRKCPYDDALLAAQRKGKVCVESNIHVCMFACAMCTHMQTICCVCIHVSGNKYDDTPLGILHVSGSKYDDTPFGILHVSGNKYDDTPLGIQSGKKKACAFV